MAAIPASSTKPSSVRYRLMVASRAIAGAFGGYALASLVTAVLSLALPLVTGASRASALLTATLLSFAVYAVAVMWAFSARSALRAWVGLAIASAVFGAALLALQGGRA